MQIGSETREVVVGHIVGDVEDHRLTEELRSCQHCFVDSELDNFKCAAKVKLAFGSILKNIEGGGCRYFYAHENNTLLDRSKLACTHDDLAKLKDFLNKTDVIESCSRERMNTKWSF